MANILADIQRARKRNVRARRAGARGRVHARAKRTERIVESLVAWRERLSTEETRIQHVVQNMAT
jgi:hypothetical protein